MTPVTAQSNNSSNYARKGLLFGGAGLGGVAAFPPSRRTLAIRTDSFPDVLRDEALIAHQTLTLLANQWLIRFGLFVVIAS